MAQITELERAKMITAVAAAIGEDEANVLATALNLNGELATREDLQAFKTSTNLAFGALRTEMAAFRSDFDSSRIDVERSISNTKTDLEGLIERTKIELENSITTTKIDLERSIANTKTELERSIANTKTELERSITGNRIELEGLITSTKTELDKAITSTKTELEKSITASKIELEKSLTNTKTDLEKLIASNKSETDDKFNDLKDSMIREFQRQTRQVFVGVIGLMATVFAMLGGLLALTGKL